MRLILRKPEEVLTSGFSVFEIDQIFLRARVELEVRADDGREVRSAFRYEVHGGLLASKVKHRRVLLETIRRDDRVQARWESGTEFAEREWVSPHWAPTEIWRALELSWPMEDATCVWPIQFSAQANSPAALQTHILAARRDCDSRGRMGWAKYSAMLTDASSGASGSTGFDAEVIKAKLSSMTMPLGIGLEPGRLLEISAGLLGLPALKLLRVKAR